MATQVQFRGGTSTAHNTFDGAAKEVTVDTSINTLVVHDGTATGGNGAGQYPLLRASGGAQDISTTGDISAADGTFTGDTTLTGDLTINTDALFVDASEKKVGIGTTDTAGFGRTFIVNGNGGFNSDSGNVGIGFNRGSSSSIGYIGTGDWAVSGAVASDFGFSSNAALVFGTGVGTPERMQIDSSGSLLIGGTLPASPATTITSAGAITAAGAATFSGEVESNKSSASSNSILFQGNSDIGQNAGTLVEKFKVKADGSATFTGDVLSGTDWQSGDGVSVDSDGFIFIRNDNESGVVFAIQNGGNGTGGHRKLSFTGDGAATFKGALAVNRAVSGDGCFHAQLNGTTKASITSAGAATFANNVTSQVGDQYSVLSYAGFTQTDSNGGTVGSITPTGDADFTGDITGGSKNFRISHPLPAKKDTYYLVHSSIEGPQADLIYSGMVTLVAGKAEINLDTAARMTEGTFLLLNTNLRRFVSNEGGWTAVKSSITGNVLTVEAQDDTCTDEVFWTVIGERKDQHMLDTNSTDENGRLITEPLKPVVEEEES